jgi:hypothetical protein
VSEGSDTLQILDQASKGSRWLSFEEVVEAGVPAAYRDWGECLLFLEGKLYDLARPGRPHQIRDAESTPAGLEFGWRHASSCGCRFCVAHHEQRRLLIKAV